MIIQDSLSYTFYQKPLKHSLPTWQFVENQGQFKFKIIRTDNGEKYYSKEWVFFCNTQCIQNECHTVPYNPQQHGVAERRNRTLLDASRSMLQVARLPTQF